MRWLLCFRKSRQLELVVRYRRLLEQCGDSRASLPLKFKRKYWYAFLFQRLAEEEDMKFHIRRLSQSTAKHAQYYVFLP